MIIPMAHNKHVVTAGQNYGFEAPTNEKAKGYFNSIFNSMDKRFSPYVVGSTLQNISGITLKIYFSQDPPTRSKQEVGGFSNNNEFSERVYTTSIHFTCLQTNKIIRYF
jgi:hypothetical protein